MKYKIHLSRNQRREYTFHSTIEIDKDINNFERSLEDYLKNNVKVACLNSGTSAIHLALILANVTEGDDVICPSFTYVATINPVLYIGAVPVFVDSENDTWNMCPLKLEAAIQDRIALGKNIKAIIFVHTYGMPSKIEEISSIASKYNVKLLEDAAEAIGSEYKGVKCGVFGDYGVFSFNNNKIITTFGGGALVCKTEEDKQKAIFLATQARDNAPHYQHSEIGYNYRMSNIVAGIGRGQMEILDKHVGLRRTNNKFYQELFKDVDGITVFTESSSDYFSNHWLSAVIVDEDVTGFSREDLRLNLLEDNIESRPLWKPMHLQPVFSQAPYYGSNISENLFKKGLCLPSGSNLTQKDRQRIATSIKKLL